MLGWCHWIGWRADWWCQIVLCRLTQTILDEALPSPELERIIKVKSDTGLSPFIIFVHLFIILYSLILPPSIPPPWCPIFQPTLTVDIFFFNPTSFCRIKGIPITKLMPSSVGTQIRDPRNWCFSWYYKGYSALLLQTPKSSPSKSLSICALQAQPSHRASKHHPFGLDSRLLFPKEKEAGAGVASMCRRVVFSFCGCSVRR